MFKQVFVAWVLCAYAFSHAAYGDEKTLTLLETIGDDFARLDFMNEDWEMVKQVMLVFDNPTDLKQWKNSTLRGLYNLSFDTAIATRLSDSDGETYFEKTVGISLKVMLKSEVKQTEVFKVQIPAGKKLVAERSAIVFADKAYLTYRLTLANSSHKGFVVKLPSRP